MRISDWSSDVCSSDLEGRLHLGRLGADQFDIAFGDDGGAGIAPRLDPVGHHAIGGAVQPVDALDGQGFGADAVDLGPHRDQAVAQIDRSEEHTSELQSLMRISYAVFCLKKKITNIQQTTHDKNQVKYTTNYNNRTLSTISS